VSVKDPETIHRLGEASQWFARLRSEPDSEVSLNAWLNWCAADPANAEAFRSVQMLWRQLDQAYTNPVDIEALVDAKDPRVSASAVRDSPFAALAGLRPRARALSWGLLAVAVCAIGGVALVDWNHSRNADLPFASTGVEHRTVTLPDGSSMDLGAKTTVAVDYRGNTRRLKLSPGEAFFRVQADKKRPFVVHAGPLDVTAVGTAFDVKHELDRITVTVQEGIVAVQSAAGGTQLPPVTSWRVGRGYQFVYSGVDATATFSAVDTSAAIAWRDGRLEYLNTPLANVLDDVNRYAEHRVEFVDPSVGRLTFTGTVFTDAIDNWLQTLPRALPVRVDRTSAGVVLISSGVAPRT
jgi:transmembrane sensor